MTLSFDPSTIDIPKGHHIDGRYIDLPGEDIRVLRPSDLQLMGMITDGGEAAVDLAVEAAKAGLKHSGWTRLAPRERGAALMRFAALIEENAVYLGQLEAMGSSRLISMTITRDAVRTAGVVRYYAEFCDKIEGTVTATDGNSLSLVKNEPYGIVGAIVPWNFPMITAAWKFAPALAAGNAVVMKTSELTPHSLLALAELAANAGLPRGLFNVVNGYGHTTGAAIVRHPDIRKISFTGSTQTGAAIMSLAAQSGIKPVVLELGGKSPQLVLSDAGDLDLVATRIAAAFMDNAGQVCTAGSRLIVEDRISDELISKIVARTKAIAAGPTWDETTTFAPIISQKQHDRIDTMVRQSISEGASALVGGTTLESRNQGNFYAPTILENVSETNVGFREEFFGPVLTVSSFSDLDEGLAQAAHPIYGLAASIHTTDIKKALKAADAIESGMVWINQHGRGPEFTYPAGGFKGSGFGKDMGRAGIEAFLRQKAIWVNYG
ncbi:aldehyde dehydrogenase family protein [Phyllobacterium chamaecytisi]|uniref:aldehyde dehydrogenase family protein n=1 Tax=Phyllobacterium chamaecytisi TaxID=2876082 RepID=UPI001CC9EF4B|nr:aldehyde dehydrogenase family protein [Phyllobacterium sp. KW56]MBZ9603613.1 aldehyde dehydrogenase family protein [Phyllobacterium sp. KW56]